MNCKIKLKLKDSLLKPDNPEGHVIRLADDVALPDIILTH